MWLVVCLAVVTPADLVVEHARIWSDGLFIGDWMAVRGGQIVSVGKRNPALVGPKTLRINAAGRIVTPGLIDSHTHLLEHAGEFHHLDLGPAKSKAEFIRMVSRAAKKLPKGAWLTGTGWSVESYPSKEQPTRAWIDGVTGDHPTVLSRMDGHSVVCNTLALRRAKINRIGPPDPRGGIIDRDANGDPTGMLREAASGLVTPPDPTAEETRIGFQDELRLANSFGVTAVSDICGPAEAPVYARLTAKDRRLRFAIYVRSGDSDRDCDAALRALRSTKTVPGWVETRGIKLFADGSIGSRSAWMKEPFNELPPNKPRDYRGVPYPGMEDGTYARDIAKASAAGAQVIVHAIGDRANAEVLNLFEAVAGHETKRFRVEHVQHLAPEDIDRFGKLGVIASMQPYHKADDGRYAERVIGRKRCETSYAYRSLLDTGARLAFGSDYDVVTIDPIVGIATAVTGRIATGKVWMPHQNITANEAFRAYLSGAAYAMKMEQHIGKIAPGFYADFIVLDGEPFSTSADWSRVRVSQTFVNGRNVYTRRR